MNFKILKSDIEDLKMIDWRKPDFLTLVDVTNGAEIEKPAKAKLLWSPQFIFILFEVADDHIWRTYKNDDDPIYDEEAVEVFLGFGEAGRKRYFEFQFSPNGVKYDAKVENPTGNRHGPSFQVDVSWNCVGLEFIQDIDADDRGEYKVGKWTTAIQIPTKEIKGSDFAAGDKLVGNLFRIDGYPEQNSFQALKANFESTPNFHTPEKFASFELIEEKSA